MRMCAPVDIKLSTSSSTLVPPTSNFCFKNCKSACCRNLSRTSLVCVASSRVGETTSAPTSDFFQGWPRWRLRSSSRIGMMKARVLPEPVTASAATSLQDKSWGIVAVWNIYKIKFIIMHCCIAILTFSPAPASSCWTCRHYWSHPAQLVIIFATISNFPMWSPCWLRLFWSEI